MTGSLSNDTAGDRSDRSGPPPRGGTSRSRAAVDAAAVRRTTVQPRRKVAPNRTPSILGRGSSGRTFRRPKEGREAPADPTADREVPAVHDGQPEPPGWHRVLLARPAAVKGDLDAGDTRGAPQFVDRLRVDRIR